MRANAPLKTIVLKLGVSFKKENSRLAAVFLFSECVNLKYVIIGFENHTRLNYSMITDNRKFDIPDFRVKKERDKVRDDFKMPFAQRYDDLTLLCRYEEGFEI